MRLDPDQLAYMRRMVDGGWSQKSIAGRFGISRIMVQRIMFEQGMRAPKKPPRHRRKVSDFKLMEVPLDDRYHCSVGADRYLEALRREHPDRQP